MRKHVRDDRPRSADKITKTGRNAKLVVNNFENGFETQDLGKDHENAEHYKDHHVDNDQLYGCIVILTKSAFEFV
jgi:hypothetical protein